MEVRTSRQKLNTRAAAVLALIIVLGFGLNLFGIVRIQVLKGAEYKAKAIINQLSGDTIPAQRGKILDANGTVLAKNLPTKDLSINVKLMRTFALDEQEKLIERLAPIIGLNIETLRKMTQGASEKTEEVLIKRKLEDEQSQGVEALQKEAVRTPENMNKPLNKIMRVLILRDSTKRYYPFDCLASTVLGMVSETDTGYGLEFLREEQLAGTPGKSLGVKDSSGRAIAFEFEEVFEPINGADQILTIDVNIQKFLEDGLKELLENSKAEAVCGIIMDPNTGAILGMADLPNFNPNNPEKITDELTEKKIAAIEDETERNKQRITEIQKQWNNVCTNWRYEPGSVYKTFVSAAVLEEKLWHPGETYSCSGSITVRDRNISCHKRTGHGTQDLTLGYVNSCNPFFVKVGQRLGRAAFLEYQKAFGFAEYTGIECQERKSSLHSAANFGDVQLASSSLGQSFEVTPIQVITAISAIANGGKLMRPYLVAKQVDENGKTLSTTQPVVRRQVVSKTTAAAVAKMMEEVVTRGSGKRAYLPGYKVAGKTGTSQKLAKISQTGDRSLYVASFACFAPADDARVAMLILADEPKGEAVGGSQLAAPIAGKVMEETLRYLNVEPRYTQAELAAIVERTPDFVGDTPEQVRERVKNKKIAVKVFGEGEKVIFQHPAAGRLVPKHGFIALYTEKDIVAQEVTVPDFSGKKLYEVLALAERVGLNVKISGNMQLVNELVSVRQNRPPGTKVIFADEVVVYFSSQNVSAEVGG
jgi:stage V sporulation protein D (sporulation-specific penicillin-binding protein)